MADFIFLDPPYENEEEYLSSCSSFSTRLI